MTTHRSSRPARPDRATLPVPGRRRKSFPASPGDLSYPAVCERDGSEGRATDPACSSASRNHPSKPPSRTSLVPTSFGGTPCRPGSRGLPDRRPRVPAAGLLHLVGHREPDQGVHHVLLVVTAGECLDDG